MLICQKSKYLPGQKTREPLVKCSEFRADDKIRKVAEDEGFQDYKPGFQRPCSSRRTVPQVMLQNVH